MPVSTDPLVRAAARNNAAWCAVMSRAHGVASAFREEAWIAAARTPVYHPDAVTLVPRADPVALAAAIDTDLPGASVKDSFADVDLTAVGFHVLFEAQWIHRPARRPSAPRDPSWEVVTNARRLREWAMAWDDGDGHADLFRPELLEDPATSVLAWCGVDGRVAAGAVTHRTDLLVGLSNVFVRDGGPDEAWPAVLDAVDALFPATPVVGYERGADLAAAVRQGFEIVGPLRIWTHPGRP